MSVVGIPASVSVEDDDNIKSFATSNDVAAGCVSVGDIVGDSGTTAIDFGGRRRRRVGIDERTDVDGRGSSALAFSVGVGPIHFLLMDDDHVSTKIRYILDLSSAFLTDVRPTCNRKAGRRFAVGVLRAMSSVR